MTTALQDLIQWTIENAFNIESQSGNEYVAIDHEELRKHFDGWLEKERQQITDAVKYGFRDANCINSDKSFDEYYDNLINDNEKQLNFLKLDLCIREGCSEAAQKNYRLCAKHLREAHSQGFDDSDK